jgi:membrane-associated phospholipid phosphatase
MPPDLLIRLIADIAVVPVVLLGAYALLFKVPKGQRFAAYSRVLMAGLTAYMLAKFIGTIYQPSELRPFELLGVEPGAAFLDNPGFPSDHALFVAAITLAVWFETKQKVISIILASLVLLICVGRVIALVHTPLDVVAGVAIAMVGGLWYLQTQTNRVEKRGSRGKAPSH